MDTSYSAYQNGVMYHTNVDTIGTIRRNLQKVAKKQQCL
ncbi:hypothetical protein T4D_4795 [Trichinella pseudospiralis]|uniref:Uncharacterized protein n=1 Tax=Trichinella pseudospiralis TaxID=6337 RepID=A0A0V1F3H9_TRIPS|nr:hypothetical protein T4D_4795 [Trichinella pseudospiralis]